VSPFAAGCAICGADLDTQRWDKGPGPLNRLGSWLSALSFGPSTGGPWVLILVVGFVFFGGAIITALLTLFS
jgi:hypothetical protein